MTSKKFNLNWVFAGSILKYSSRVKLLILCLFTKNKYSVNIKDDSNLLIVYGCSKLNRSDYNGIIDFINRASNKKASRIDYYRCYSVRYLIVILCSAILYSLKNKESLFHSFIYAKVKNEEKIIIKIINEIKFDRLITFCDAIYVDSIFTQYCNYLNIETITLQHGQYYIKNEERAENHALLSLTSKYFLSWGKATEDEFLKNSDNKYTNIVLVGLPFEAYRVKSKFEIKDKIKCFDVYLNSDNEKEINIQLLILVNQFCKVNGIDYNVRYHPKSNREIYKDYVRATSKKYSSEESVSIVISSGVIVKLLAKGESLLCFYQKEDIFSKNLVSFKNLIELESEMKKIRQKVSYLSDICNGAQDYFISGGDSLYNYSKFFEDVNNV